LFWRIYCNEFNSFVEFYFGFLFVSYNFFLFNLVHDDVSSFVSNSHRMQPRLNASCCPAAGNWRAFPARFPHGTAPTLCSARGFQPSGQTSRAPEIGGGWIHVGLDLDSDLCRILAVPRFFRRYPRSHRIANLFYNYCYIIIRFLLDLSLIPISPPSYKSKGPSSDWFASRTNKTQRIWAVRQELIKDDVSS
jgi:hypothetical protein